MEFECFRIGEMVQIDNHLDDKDAVEVVYQSPKRMFTRVRCGDYEWELMTDRLTKIEKPNKIVL